MDTYGGNMGCFGGKLLPSPSKRKLIRSLTVGHQRSRKKFPVKPSDYELYEEVGVGTSAIVYRARCVPFKEIVAIKVVDLDKSSATLDTICCGVQVMALTSHPNVLRAHCSFVVDCNLWVVMPYIAGGSCLHLMKAIQQEGFKESVIASFLREVLKALYYLHNQGQIHGNVKAGNILVDANGAVLLADFGFSTCTFENGDKQCSIQAFMGTSWMAPEVKQKGHSCGPGVDIWSFGITALELSHGHDAFNKDSPTKVLQTSLQKINGRNNNERHKKLSKPFLKMIAKCLEKDPLKRPSAIKLLKHSFFNNALNSEVAVDILLRGLPPLGDQIKALKLKEAGIIDEKKVSSEEQKDQSQSEYKQGVSSWNFNLKDSEFQTSSIQDDKELHYTKAIENPNPMTERESMVKGELVGAENNEQGGDHMVQVHSLSLEAIVPLQSPNGIKEIVDAFEGDTNPYSMPEMEHIKDHNLVVLQAQKDNASKVRDFGHALEKKDNNLEDGHHVSEQSHNAGNDPPARDKSNRDRHQLKLERNSSRSTNFHRVNVTHSADCICRQTNVAGNRDSSGEISIVPAVQKKGRFKVTSETLDPEPLMAVPSSTSSTSNVPMATILPFMQNISERNDTQRDQIVNLIKSLSQGKFSTAYFSNLGSKPSSCNGFDNLMIETPSETEQGLLQQVVELQIRVTNIAHEIQEGKRINVQLERQLSALQLRKEVDHKRDAP